jgi:RHS repeat-associated protein
MTKDETGRQFVWDAWNRLVEVKDSGGVTLVRFEYDAHGWRIIADDGTVRDFFYSSAWQVLEERVSGIATVQYVWSPVYVDALVLRDRDTDANGTLDERLYVQQDANWNVTALLNTSGTVVERIVQDPYGKVTFLDSSWTPLTGSAFAWLHTHQGLRFEALAGLFDNRNRWYSPTLMRFVSNDPIGLAGGYTNLYLAYGNGPGNARDPLGLGIFEQFSTVQHYMDVGRRLRTEGEKAGMDYLDLKFYVWGGLIAERQRRTAYNDFPLDLMQLTTAVLWERREAYSGATMSARSTGSDLWAQTYFRDEARNQAWRAGQNWVWGEWGPVMWLGPGLRNEPCPPRPGVPAPVQVRATTVQAGPNWTRIGRVPPQRNLTSALPFLATQLLPKLLN